ncbi:MAG: hypothetical protein KIS66_09690 [Fimbriimonadaceae bacterium]|nr:hypothetical protein [Fimbriimonadaceae bacterium]
MTPEPLPPDTLLARRFRLLSVLGQGSLGIVYRAQDLDVGDEAVVKELAPLGSRRAPDGRLEWPDYGEVKAGHLRRVFVEDAESLRTARLPRVPTPRAAFQGLGTAFVARASVPGSDPLQTLIGHQGPLPVEAILDVLLQLTETLERAHRLRRLHRNLKPANILLASSGDAALVDFGGVREWLLDATHHPAMLTSLALAAPEQLQPRGFRGPATDVYGLAATAHAMLYGVPPTPPPERDPNRPLLPAPGFFDDSHRILVAALERGLALAYADRPQTVAEFRDLLTRRPSAARPGPSLAELDDRALRLKTLRFRPMECPGGGILDRPKPLKRGVCPVCRKGAVLLRELSPRLCPACRVGVLHPAPNKPNGGSCPCCRTGTLHAHTPSLLKRVKHFDCDACGAAFTGKPEALVLSGPGHAPHAHAPGSSATWDEWLARASLGRPLLRCDGCGTRFVDEPSGNRRHLADHPSRDQSRHPDEWSRIAAGLDPECGNAVCNACKADFFVDGDQVTALDATWDPYGFFARHAGRLHTWDDLCWIGAGKESGNPGLVSSSGTTEFDEESGYLRLVHTELPALARFAGRLETLEDWHRLAHGLPRRGHEAELLDALDQGIRAALRRGDLPFDSRRPEVLWRGEAERIEESADGEASRHKGNLLVTKDEVSFGGLLRKWRVPTDAVEAARADHDSLLLTLKGEDAIVEFEIAPLEFTADMMSGPRTLRLDAQDLAARLSR